MATAIGECLENSFEEADSLKSRAGKGLQYLGHLLNRPFEWSTETFVKVLFTPIQPGKYGDSEYRIVEIAKRALGMGAHLAISPLTVLLLAAGCVVQGLGECLSSKPYYYKKGKGEERWDRGDYTLLTCNTCTYWGGLPITGGGVDPASGRIEPLIDIFRRENPDVLALQEVSFGEGLKLIEALKDRYAHFYTNIGGLQAKVALFQGRFNVGTELFIASRAPLVSPPQFVPLIGKRSGFFCLETPSCWAINVHLPTQSEDNLKTRMDVLNQVHQKAEELEKETGKPCFVMGDYNIQRTGLKGDEYSAFGLGEKFYDPCTKKYPEVNEDTATCTNELLHARGIQKGEEPSEIDDYVLLSKNWENRLSVDVELGKDTYDLKGPELALSDHRYYAVRVRENAGERT